VCELIERNTLKELKISVKDFVELNLIFNSMKKNTSLESLHILTEPYLGSVGFDLDSFEFLKNSNLKKFFYSNPNEKIDEKMSQELEMNQNLIELETNTKNYSFLKTNKTLTSLKINCLNFNFLQRH
jgi:hypothetical protein